MEKISNYGAGGTGGTGGTGGIGLIGGTGGPGGTGGVGEPDDMPIAYEYVWDDAVLAEAEARLGIDKLLEARRRLWNRVELMPIGGALLVKNLVREAANEPIVRMMLDAERMERWNTWNYRIEKAARAKGRPLTYAEKTEVLGKQFAWNADGRWIYRWN